MTRTETSSRSADRHRSRRGERGISLVEALLVMALLGLGMLAAARMLNHSVAGAANRTGLAIAALSAATGGKPTPAVSAPSLSPAPAPEQKHEDGGGFSWGGLWDGAKKVGGFVLDNFTPVGDIETLLDPNASTFDKILAGTSLVASVVPIPGVGPGVKAATRGIKLAARAVKDARKVERGVEAARDVERGARALEDGEHAATGARRAEEDAPELAGGRRDARQPEAPNQSCPGGQCGIDGSSCFVAGTLVHTQAGLRRIEDVEAGELLWSRDPWTGELGLQPVAARIVTDQQLVLALTLEAADGSEELHVTGGHRFWTQRGWTEAQALSTEDRIWLRASRWARVIGSASLADRVTVYNFEVEHYHTYFVGTDGYWVHNDYEPPVGRRGALNQSKRDLGIPRTTQPDKVDSVPLTRRDGSRVLGSDGMPIMTREYTYTRPDGSKVVIQDHSAGHQFGEGGVGDQGPHFNVRPPENTRTGHVPGTKDHYPFRR